jgi:hypothetical protein
MLPQAAVIADCPGQDQGAEPERTDPFQDAAAIRPWWREQYAWALGFDRAHSRDGAAARSRSVHRSAAAFQYRMIGSSMPCSPGCFET